jgi:transcriptional regulator
MRHNPAHAVDDERIVRLLIEENPWATIVSSRDGEMVASHYPILLEDRDDEVLSIVTHVGRPDEKVHDFGVREVMVIVAGPHGYVSPSWYTPGDTPAPTWNFIVAHCYGIPEVLPLEENKATLTRLVAHFERRVEDPVYLAPETADRLAPGTVGLRIPITRWTAKLKMSQDKSPQSREQVLEALRKPGPYQNLALVSEMERALGESSG